jgi:uncharacterized RDD family membrane protein YckC
MTQSGTPTPQPPATPPPAPSGSGWTAAPPPQAVGPAGLVYGDVPNRAIAYIIDVIILFVINIIIIVLLGIVGLNATSIDTSSGVIGSVSYNPVVGVIPALVFTAINGVYFIYLWTTQRGTIGQRLLSLQVGNATDGATITRDSGIRRWIALGAPFSIAQALNPLPGLGILIGLAALVWFIALLYTTATSPTKQGIHDKYANTIVAKAARTVA